MKSSRLHYSIIFFIIALNQLLLAQIIINEVMFNPDGSEYDNEFIELYNTSNDSLSLDGYSIGDNDEDDLILAYPGMSSLKIPPQSYALILDSSYPDSDNYYLDLIPDSIVKFIIEDGSFGKYGFSNSKPETIYLKQESQTRDSISYSLLVDPGFSYERKYFHLNEWTSSLLPKGTPGFKNSITPFDFDLELKFIAATDTLISNQETVNIECKFKNWGLSRISEFYYELHLNGQAINDQVLNTALNATDSLIINEEITLNPGMNQLKINCSYQDDENLSNNSDSLYLFYSPENSSKILLNEFVRKTAKGYSEWLEIYNPNSIDLPLSFYKLSDSNKDPLKLANQGVIRANDYFVICKDSSIFTFATAINSDKVEINSALPDFNNTDTIYLYSLDDQIIDSLAYESESWLETNNYSMEKINTNLPSQRISNWNISIDEYGTPAAKNSIFTETTSSQKGDISLLKKSITPDSDGKDDNLGVKLDFDSGFIYLDAYIYNKKGQKIHTIHQQAYLSGTETFFWNCRDSSNRLLPIGAYILLIKVNSSNFSEKVFKKVFYIVT